MKLIAAGCSVTHGAELDHPFMSEENAQQSYPALLAKNLNLKCINVALSGASNDYIFHTAVEEIKKHDDVSVLLVCWTHSPRLTWRAFDRTYIIHPTFATALKDVYQDPKHRKDVGKVYISSDANILNELEQGVKFAVSHVIDCDELDSKRDNHSLALKAICDQRQITFIELDVMDFKNVGKYDEEERHPNNVEHALIADHLLATYFPNGLK